MILATLRNGEYSSMQWLAIAPLLALSSSLTMGLLAGLMTFLQLIIISLSISLLRTLIPYRLCIPVLILLLGTFACLMDMGMKYYFYEFRGAFDIYLPLLAVNSLIYAISGDYFFRNSWSAALRQALITGTVFMILYTALALFREALGYGTMFRDLGMLGEDAAGLHTIRLIDGFSGISLIHSPPGALLSCGLMAALIKYIYKGGRSRAVTDIH